MHRLERVKSSTAAAWSSLSARTFTTVSPPAAFLTVPPFQFQDQEGYHHEMCISISKSSLRRMPPSRFGFCTPSFPQASVTRALLSSAPAFTPPQSREDEDIDAGIVCLGKLIREILRSGNSCSAEVAGQAASSRPAISPEGGHLQKAP